MIRSKHEEPGGDERGVEETNTLRSKSEMLAEVSSLRDSMIPEEITAKSKKQFLFGPTRSRNLWSKKSSELYSQLLTILTDDKPVFSTLKNLQVETFIGVTNTFISSSATLGSLDRIYSSWSYYNKSFVIRKVPTSIARPTLQ